MANLDSEEPIEVSIPDVEICEKITRYIIIVKLGSFSWKVIHRYSEFADLHELLVTNHGVARDFLPPKKIIGNTDPVFIKKRRADLELYLQTVVSFMSAAIPEQLAEFLDMKLYELNYLLQDIARYYFKEGDLLLQENISTTFNSLQLMAISKQMKSKHPNVFAYDKESDFANIVDFCSNLKKLLIEGSWGTYRCSNIILNELSYNLGVFKNIETLIIDNASIFTIERLGTVRKTVKKLVVHNCKIKSLSDILICDSLHREVEDISENLWPNLEFLDLSFNQILDIDSSVILTPKLEHLNLESNQLSSVGLHLTKLPNLIYLNLSKNRFTQLDDLHTKLGNVKRLDLSQNNISNLEGFSKLYSIVSLNLSSNKVLKVCDINAICHLPCVEELLFTGNPVATVVDYRIKVLEIFNKKAWELCLDNERPTEKELDKVSVLQALRSAREGRLPTLSRLDSIPPMSTVSLLIERPDVATIAK